MRKAKSIWHDARKERPEKSGMVIIYDSNGVSVMNVQYSKKYDAFNVLDTSRDDSTMIVANLWTTYEELGLPKREG